MGVEEETGDQRYALRMTPHVTCVTRHAQNAKPTSRCRTVCTMARHDATGVTTPRQTVKASPHRLKWMLSHGAPADPSDPWNSHAAPVSPRQNGAFLPTPLSLLLPMLRRTPCHPHLSLE